MNEQVKIEKEDDQAELSGFDLLRAPFAPHQIGRLPKPTRKQHEEVKADYTKGIRCQECGQWHHPDVIHLDYVGHAALTDRLLDVDPLWYWEPMAKYENGLPAFDEEGGLWMRLYILGHSRIGYGSADGKSGGDAKKEVIGDGLRNAAMRFGCALDLWHKGELHTEVGDDKKNEPLPKTSMTKTALKAAMHDLCHSINTMTPKDGLDHLIGVWQDNAAMLRQAKEDYPDFFKSAEEAKDAAKVRFERAESDCPI